MPFSAISQIMPLSQRTPPFITGWMPAAFIFSARALKAAQVFGSSVAPTRCIAFFDAQSVLMR